MSMQDLRQVSMSDMGKIMGSSFDPLECLGFYLAYVLCKQGSVDGIVSDEDVADRADISIDSVQLYKDEMERIGVDLYTAEMRPVKGGKE